MQVTLELVGYLASIGLPNGFKGGPVSLAEGATIEDLLNTVGLPLPTPNLIIRRKQRARLTDVLEDQDVVAVVPPIGGG
jgi:sulfur carrier protein ThiS